ncbi:MAG: hypothetical protein HYU27_07540 [Acidobacteria bacterium]|nr:hypothetical protein [Acidobacteriota bacterium]
MYFSADVETDGPIPGPFSMLSFALVHAGRFDGSLFERPTRFEQTFYRELKPISVNFQSEALRVNGLDRKRLCREGDLKTAFAVKAAIPIAQATKSDLIPGLRAGRKHTHNALDDAIEQAEISANIFQWEGVRGRHPERWKNC